MMAVKRDKNGRILPGSVLNPEGKTAVSAKTDAEAACAKYKIDPLEYLASVVADPKVGVTTRVKAASTLLDRLYGKPEASVQISDKTISISIAKEDGTVDKEVLKKDK